MIEIPLSPTVTKRLAIESSRFPTPISESTMTYNYNKLMNILQNQEVENLIKDKDLRELGRSQGAKYHDITKELITNGAQPKVLQKYNEHQEIVETLLSGDMAIFAKQWGLSVKALYYYKRKEFKRAIDLSIECIIMNDYLIQQGIYSLLFRLLEQNKNISRVYFKKGEIEKGAELGGALLNYLFNGECAGLHGQTLRDLKYWSESPYVREGYSYECFLAFVSLFIHFSDSIRNNADVFNRLFGHLDFEINTPDRLIIANWIAAKKMLYNSSPNEFLLEFLIFMKEPTSKLYSLLKISLVLDVIKLFKNRTDESSLVIIANLNNYLNLQLNAEQLLKSDLSAKNLVILE